MKFRRLRQCFSGLLQEESNSFSSGLCGRGGQNLLREAQKRAAAGGAVSPQGKHFAPGQEL